MVACQPLFTPPFSLSLCFASFLSHVSNLCCTYSPAAIGIRVSNILQSYLVQYNQKALPCRFTPMVGPRAPINTSLKSLTSVGFREASVHFFRESLASLGSLCLFPLARSRSELRGQQLQRASACETKIQVGVKSVASARAATQLKALRPKATTSNSSFWAIPRAPMNSYPPSHQLTSLEQSLPDCDVPAADICLSRCFAFHRFLVAFLVGKTSLLDQA